MKPQTIALLLLLICANYSSSATPNENYEDSISVYIFMHEACIISQHYTLQLGQMHEQYANQHLQFVGLFPDFSSKPNKIRAFQEKYSIPFELRQDYFHVKKELLGAEVMPEVIVYNETQQIILYKGRIDNTYARVGKKRRVTTTAELKDVLEAITHDRPIPIANTQAIGCFIGNNKLD